MNKKQIIEAVAKDTKLTKVEITKVLDSFQVVVKKSVKKGDRVQLTGFGTFDMKKRAARNGVNPSTGQKIKIRAKKVPVFRPGKEFKSMLSPVRK